VVRAAVALLLLAPCGAQQPGQGVVASPPATASPVFVALLRSKLPINPTPLAADPYARWSGRTPPQPPAGTVCGVRFEADGVHYRLAIHPSDAEARAAGFAVTHVGACGTCSTLQDLAVYLEKPDLTTPVRSCGMKSGGEKARVACLEALGFSEACARTWYYNIENTRRECFGVCMWSWIRRAPPTKSDGSLNGCLQCDEDRSGPVFKATAGRTRRNSGIRSSIPRRDDELAPVVHDYVPDDAPVRPSEANPGGRWRGEPLPAGPRVPSEPPQTPPSQ